MSQASFSKKWVIPIAATFPFLAIVYAFSLGPSPRKTLQEFKTREAPESALMAPLLEADPKDMAPVVIAEIPTKTMVRRSYAIAYLGRIKSRAALPALETILFDRQEKDYFRADALKAIRKIDPPRAKQHAARYLELSDALGQAARKILGGGKHVVGSLR